MDRPNFSGDDNDAVSNYFRRRGGKKYGLLTAFNAVVDMVIPQKAKKTFWYDGSAVSHILS